MNCPNCSKAMHPHRIKDVDLDECKDCKGVWFDQDELRRAKDQTDSDLNWMDFELWKYEDRYQISPKPIKCPKCSVGLASVQYGNTGVEVDCCAKCQGVWLEENEFGKIIDALTDELATKSLSDYFKASLEEGKEIVAGPESFFSEWKDFTTILRMFQYRFFIENPKLQDTMINIQRTNPFQ